ncbi:MAG TPA: hypothetical protein VFB75_09280, partial [Burkholderiales bacterium]|nr:hypothetical protein [Burkholderiales bacterium]
MSKKARSPASDQTSASRRKFLAGTAAAAAVPVFAMAAEKAPEKAAAKAPEPAKPAAPAVVSSTGAQSMRWQSTWPAKDIFHEYALDFAKKVNDMTGGDLRIEVLPAGAVV